MHFPGRMLKSCTMPSPEETKVRSLTTHHDVMQTPMHHFLFACADPRPDRFPDEAPVLTLLLQSVMASVDCGGTKVISDQ
jgi:hypothetical protein